MLKGLGQARLCQDGEFGGNKMEATNQSPMAKRGG